MGARSGARAWFAPAEKDLEVVSKPSIGFKVSRPRSAGQERGLGRATAPIKKIGTSIHIVNISRIERLSPTQLGPVVAIAKMED